MSRGFWLAVGVIAIASGAGWWWWRREMEMQDLIDQLTDALPGRIGQWARQIAAAARATAPTEIGELRWGLILGAVMDRESAGGTTLSPRGAAGTGDAGHGRGLMQIDDRAHSEFTSGDDWKDPQVNVTYGARLLRALYDQSAGNPDDGGQPDLAAALAAYNAGPRALRAANPDALTTHGNYGADVLARVESYRAALES